MKSNASASPRGLLALLILLFVFLNQSCYHYRITAPTADTSTEYERRTVHSLFWGLVQPKEIQVDLKGHAAGIGEVHLVNNFGNSILTTVTLGIWCPTTIKWRLAKPCPTVTHTLSPTPK